MNTLTRISATAAAGVAVVGGWASVSGATTLAADAPSTTMFSKSPIVGNDGWNFFSGGGLGSPGTADQIWSATDNNDLGAHRDYGSWIFQVNSNYTLAKAWMSCSGIMTGRASYGTAYGSAGYVNQGAYCSTWKGVIANGYQAGSMGISDVPTDPMSGWLGSKVGADSAAVDL